MRRQPVIFCLENRKIPTDFDLDQIHYGQTLHLDLEAAPPAVYFAQGPTAVTACKVGFVSRPGPEGRFVSLFRRARYARDLGQQVHHAVPDAFIAAEAEALIERIANRVPFDKIHDLAAIGDSPLGRIQAALDRLQLVRMLSKPIVGADLWLHYRPLVAYLLLTCFDLLGQVEEWVDLRPWLDDSQYARERELANIPANSPPEKIARALVTKYDELYGVRSSFRRFIDQVLPRDQRLELFACVEIEEFVASPLSTELDPPKPHGEKKKIDWLYSVRNTYTHAAAYEPGVHPAIIPPDMRGDDQRWVMGDELSKTRIIQRTVRRWPEVLEECVRAGLASYLRLAAELSTAT